MNEPTQPGMFFNDKCRFCHDYNEKAEPYLCPYCKQKILDYMSDKGPEVDEGFVEKWVGKIHGIVLYKNSQEAVRAMLREAGVKIKKEEK